MTDADNRMNTVHFGSDPADVRIPINSEIRIQKPGTLMLEILALAEVCAF